MSAVRLRAVTDKILQTIPLTNLKKKKLNPKEEERLSMYPAFVKHLAQLSFRYRLLANGKEEKDSWLKWELLAMTLNVVFRTTSVMFTLPLWVTRFCSFFSIELCKKSCIWIYSEMRGKKKGISCDNKARWLVEEVWVPRRERRRSLAFRFVKWNFLVLCWLQDYR